MATRVKWKATLAVAHFWKKGKRNIETPKALSRVEQEQTLCFESFLDMRRRLMLPSVFGASWLGPPPTLARSLAQEATACKHGVAATGQRAG